MRILIAYDGSAAADIAIDSLSRAGLPIADVEALVVSVAEVWLPPPARNEVLDDTFPLQIPPGLKRAREHAAAIMVEGEQRAERGKKRVQQVFPDWSVSTGVVNGSPADFSAHRACINGRWRLSTAHHHRNRWVTGFRYRRACSCRSQLEIRK